MKEYYSQFNISDNVLEYAQKIIDGLKERFQAFDEVSEINQLKVMKAMQECRVRSSCFNYTSGYGYNDVGRDTLEEVYARIFHTEDALVRPQITCGTHALSLSLSANLRPGDELLYPAGGPYDTLEEVIGIRPSLGSLAEYGITCKIVELKEDNSFDYDAIRAAIKPNTKMASIQRSKGYKTRPSYSVEQIGELIAFLRSIKEDIIIMVDNCYGEFTELMEPSDVGADMTVGSLIKNPGGGIAPMGGYIAGRKDLIAACAARLTAPGLAKEVGASLDVMRYFYQGLYFAPVVVASALKTALFAAALYENLGYDVIPDSKEERHDIIQAVTLRDPEALKAFCRGIQAGSPVDAYVTPEPWDMPGYDDPVIMAAGTFVQGASIELSADGPMREPYAVYFQGGLTWPNGKLGILKSLQYLVDQNLVRIPE